MNTEMEWHNFSRTERPVGTVEDELFKVRFSDGSEHSSARFSGGKWINFIGYELVGVKYWALNPHRQRDGGFKYEIPDLPPLIIEEYSRLILS